MTVWHDEMERWERTGHLDEGPCWCPQCLPAPPDAFAEFRALVWAEIVRVLDPVVTWLARHLPGGKS